MLVPEEDPALAIPVGELYEVGPLEARQPQEGLVDEL